MLQTMLPPNEEVLQQLERILRSQSLHGSEGLRSFLQFVVTKTLDKQENQLKEYTIATEVFGRDGTFDPRVDSVVRVQAGRLRIKVQEYYSAEGKKDPILIEIPKGHYSPSFSYLKPPQVKDLAQSKEFESVPTEPKVPPDRVTTTAGSVPRMQTRLKRDRRIMVMLILLCIALGSSTLYFYWRQNEKQASVFLPKSDPVGMRVLGPIWQDFLQSSGPILVAYSNTLFEGTAETGMKLLTPLDSIKPRAGFSQPQKALESMRQDRVITEHYTGVGEPMGVYYLGEFFGKLGRSLRVKRSLLLTWEDLKSENFIFLGSPAENLLLRDLPQEQHFLFKTVRTASGKEEFGIVNLKPRPGEQRYYMVQQQGPSRSQISEDYALISLLKGLDPKTRLMILAGITTYGTQAAVEYVVKPEYAADLVSHLNMSRSKNVISLPPYYQLLIRVKVNGQVPINATYVTHHVLD